MVSWLMTKKQGQAAVMNSNVERVYRNNSYNFVVSIEGVVHYIETEED